MWGPSDPVVWQGERAGQPIGDPEREAARRVIEATVAAAFGLPLQELSAPTRRRANVAFARQVGMYVAHVALGLSLTETGQVFGRDRTTASHACRVVEDRRDDGDVDRMLDAIEAVVLAWKASLEGSRRTVEVQHPGRTS